jgi:predicted amidohydrolase YtcJ
VPTAFAAATFGAARAGQDHHLGMLTVGARANLSIWQPFADQRPDGLPTLEDELPVCAGTVARGRAIYSDGSIDGFPFTASEDG